LKERTGAPKKVYRGDGRGMDQNSLANLTNVQGITAQGTLDLTFAGAVRHVCSNTDPGGVISTTADIDCAVHFAINSHPYGLVYEMEVTDYVDMCKVLSDRNFKNRYEAQKEFIVPKRISKAQIKKVMLYRKGGVPNDIWTSGTLLAYRNVNHGTLGDVVVVQQ
ncbi:MAG TPA: hypothetical protein VLL76_08240, partial [Candidatus Omnitrophota bacterium]|nr:hypothetical protein [Candidatus Omnitrophota bacterium]